MTTVRRIDPQPDFAQYHVWRGEVIHDSSHRQWCWRGEVISDRWEGDYGLVRALSERAPRDAFAAISRDGTAWWVDVPDPYPHAHRLHAWAESWGGAR